MSVEPGQTLAHYEILEKIGQGGMGQVYRARDRKLGRDVAIKVLPDEFAADEERLRRFQREAKVLASLNHPGIASIYGLEKEGDTHFLVLELVPGETLAGRIARGRIRVDEARDLAKKIAEALEEAHERGIVHRDLKPANIKLTPDDKVKVLDFGLAKALEEEPSAVDNSVSPTITRGTQVGVILGTAAYMSPEQARGKRVDKRTDIFAFGSVLYEMLTGKRAFRGEDVSETLAAVLRDEPSWELLPQDTPTDVERLLRRCLRKDPLRRLHDAADVRIELEDASSTATSHSAPSKALFYAMASATAIALAFAVGAFFFPNSAATAMPVTRSVLPLASNEPLFLTASPTLAISPDGRALAYVTTRGDTTQLYLRLLDELRARPVENSDGASMPFFSPEGQWLGFARDGTLMKVSLSGGAPVVVGALGDASPRGASWTSDGRIVFVPSSQGGIRIIPEDGGESETIGVPDRDLGEKTFRFPDVLPGDSAVLFTLGTGEIESWDDAAIAVMSLETGEYRVVLEGGSHAIYSPTGHLVYARDGSLFAVPFDVDSLNVTGAPIPVLGDVITSPTKGPASFSVSRTGSLVYAPGEPWGVDFRIVSVDREGRSENLVDVPRAYVRAKPSPAGDALVLAVDDANAGLWIFDLERGTSSRLVSGFDNNAPVWTPDGEKLAFSSNRTGVFQIYWQDAAGRGQPERLVSRENLQVPTSWARTGNLAFSEFHPDTSWDLWVLTLDGERSPTPFLRTAAQEEFPEFSPDGRWIAYQSDESGRKEVYLRTFPDSGAKWPISTNGGALPIWSPNGGEIFYREDNKMMAVNFRLVNERPVLGKPTVLFARDFVFDAYGDASYSIMPDGERFVLVEESDAVPPPSELVLVQNWFEELRGLVPPQ